MERLIASQTPLGRACIYLRLRFFRLAWLIAIHGAKMVKRALDVIGAVSMLVAFSPVMLALVLLVKLDGGPVLFRQIRIGRLGREFVMFKFRSMSVDAEARFAELLSKNEKPEGITFKIKNDPRITKIGRFIRKSSIDELPQLFNVLKGDMSLVGPRPALQREVALYTDLERRRLLAKPGVTCLWQVGEREGRLFEIGDRNNIDFFEQVELDVRYIETHSVWRDLWLMVKTVPAVLLGKGM